jgi:NADH-quinone oxidoreductase subunit L
MGGLRKKMPITHFTFLIACLAIAGIPPFSGFFSKDEILTAALLKNPVYYVLGVAGALMTSFYMFRLYAMAFRGEFRGTEAQASHLHESPSAMTIPLIILAVLSVAGGWVGIPEVLMHDAHKLQAFLAPVLEGIGGPADGGHHLSHSTELMLMGGVLVLIIGVITFAWKKYSKYTRSEEVSSTGVARFLENKWYVDELYDTIISKPLKSISAFMNLRVERQVIDGVVNGVGKAVQYGSRQLRLIQSGQVGSYILIMVIFLILFFVLQLFWNLQ